MTVNLLNEGHVHQDFCKPIHAGVFTDNKLLGKYRRTSSVKAAKLAFIDRHLLTAVNQLTGSSLCTL